MGNESLTEYIESIVSSPIIREAYSKAQKLGIVLEKWLYMVLSFFFPSSKGYKVQHNNWKNYTSSMGYSTDIRLFLRNKLIAVFECKNWRLLPKHRYGLKDAKEQILTRFHNAGTNIKVLTISFKKQLSNRALSYLESNNIQILETGKLIGKKDFRSKLVYSLGKQIKQLISNFKLNQKTKQQPLFCFNNSLINSYNTTNTNTITNINKQNDSELENNPLVSWIFSLLTQSKVEKRHKEWVRRGVVNALL
jgi:hypothetical protein